MSGRVIQLAIVLTVGVMGGECVLPDVDTKPTTSGVYTFGPPLERYAKEQKVLEYSLLYLLM